MKTTAQKLAKPTIRVGRLRQWIPITLILLLATGLDIYHLGTESLWLDEIYSVHDAKELVLPSVRPLYFIFLRIWMLFGTSDAWLRGLSVLFGVGSVFLTYQLGRRIAGESTGLIAAFILAVSYVFIEHSQEVRMYTLSTCLGIGGTLALTHALERPTASSQRWWAGMRLLVILATPLNVTLLLADIILVWWRFRHQRPRLFAFAKLILLIGILWLPCALALATATPKFMGGWVAQLPRPGAYDVLYMLARFTGWDFGTVNVIAHANKQFGVYFFRAYALIVICLLGVALVNKQHPKLSWITVWAFVPSVILFLVSYFSSSLWIDRYLLLVCPYFLILLAAGFRQIWRWQRLVAIVVALIYAVAISGGLVHYYTAQNREDWRGVAQTISKQEKPGDDIGVIIFSDRSRLGVEHYYHGSAPIYEISTNFTLLDQKNESLTKNVLEGVPAIRTRLWLVYRHPPVEEKWIQLVQTNIKDKLHVQKYWEFESIDLFLVTPRTK